MNAELQQTLELARTLDQMITFSENQLPTPPVRSAAKRVREALIGALRKAIDDLNGAWPKSDPKEIARCEEALEHGEVPKAPEVSGQMSEVSLPKVLDREIGKLETRIGNRKRALAAA
ncbi:MAG: hypothetical protein M3O82_01870 [Verrucomicrobiota bacterium]|nr:hypothetical protein [Verrucomicrobiota bacterium]